MAKRKLTTIFCADAVQYGAMMASNETATLQRLQDYRSVMREQFENYNGREINTWGDAIIVEFESVVEAVRCAVEIQAALSTRNHLLPEEERMLFRIGINLGDVIHQGDDIYGDGVNVASRLESLADPGGILVSKQVYEFASRQLAVGFDFTGPQASKPGEEPIEGYRVRIGGANRVEDVDGDSGSEFSRSTLKRDAQTLAGNIGKLSTVARFRRWFEAQGRAVRLAVTMIGFFLTINVVFTGIATPWFIFPSIPFILMVVLGRKKET